jgi:virginiamycin B lyase
VRAVGEISSRGSGWTGAGVAALISVGLLFPSCSDGRSDAGSPDDGATPGSGEETAVSTDPDRAATSRSTTTNPSSTESAEPGPSATESQDPAVPSVEPVPVEDLELVAFPVPAGSRPHDVAPAADGGVWYTAQGSGELGWLDPTTGRTRQIPLGTGSRPHGVIVDTAGSAWITDGGLDAIVRFDPATDEVTEFPLPSDRPDANLNTAAFDGGGRLWFTGQNGIHGVLDPASGQMEVFDSPRGRGPYGMAATPSGDIYFASLAGSYVGSVAADGSVTVLDPPTPEQGSRRVWADSAGDIWVSEWNAGQLTRYHPPDGTWTTWPLPGAAPQAYAVYVDEADIVWVSDFGGNAIHRFDPIAESFSTFELASSPGDVRQILGRPGEVWGAESAADQLVVIRTVVPSTR